MQTAGPVLSQAQLLVHMTQEAYPFGTEIGGWPTTRWSSKESPSQRHLEDVLENVRPVDAPSRRSAVYATSHIELVRTWIRASSDPERPMRIYRVRVASGAKSWGHVDMRYVDWMLRNTSDAPHPSHYWARIVNPSGTPSWEVLTEKLVILEEVPHERIQVVRDMAIGIPLALHELFTADMGDPRC